MSTECSQCGGTDIEYDQARGDAVCTACGCVLEDNIIVSEVTFAEQSGGASSVIGQFVSSESSKIPLSGSGFRHGMAKDSREITIGHAKKRLSNLGHLLKLNQHCIDSALMFFKMALQMNLTRGRKSSIIDTACLYLVCRSEGTPHLLLDFSDVLQINVYSLGRAYLRLANALHINPPAIDPCLYIHRFAHKLELGEKTHDVSMTALRLVARMKRDWIHHGRRPSGLCGAALLVSARIHNFSRSVREVSRVVKLSEGTLRKRLGDFKDTASSRLTIDEFLKIDLEQEHDPPSYLEAKKKAKQKEKVKSVGGGDLEEEEEDENGLEEEGVGGFSAIKSRSVDDIIAKARFTESFLVTSASIGLTDNLDQLARLGESEEDRATADSRDRGVLYTDDINEEEMDQMLLSEDEVKIKSQLWFAENGEFLKERELRRERLALEKAEKEKQRKGKTRTRRPRLQQQHHQQTYSNAGEAIGKMLVERKISTKINYDVLRDIEIDSNCLEGGPAAATAAAASTPTQSSPDVVLDPDAGGAGASLVAISPQVVSTTTPVASGNSDLTITRTHAQNRLPSLGSRKRSVPSFVNRSPHTHSHEVSKSADNRSSIAGGNPPRKRTKVSFPTTTPRTMEEVLSEKLKEMKEVVTPPVVVVEGGTSHDPIVVVEGGTSHDPIVVVEGGTNVVVEETGPVEYCEEDGGEEEGEGLDDEEMEDLIYEDDPLLAHSDNEEYDDDC